jgi:hypothetical protein
MMCHKVTMPFSWEKSVDNGSCIPNNAQHEVHILYDGLLAVASQDTAR